MSHQAAVQAMRAVLQKHGFFNRAPLAEYRGSGCCRVAAVGYQTDRVRRIIATGGTYDDALRAADDALMAEAVWELQATMRAARQERL